MVRCRKLIDSAINSKDNLLLELMLFKKLWDSFNPDQSRKISSTYRPQGLFGQRLLSLSLKRLFWPSEHFSGEAKVLWSSARLFMSAVEQNQNGPFQRRDTETLTLTLDPVCLCCVIVCGQRCNLIYVIFWRNCRQTPCSPTESLSTTVRVGQKQKSFPFSELFKVCHQWGRNIETKS